MRGPILYIVDPLINYRRHMGSVSRENDAEWGRLESRYHTLREMEEDIKNPKITDQTKDIFEYEYFWTCLAYGYHCRVRNKYSQSMASYIDALRLRPGALRAYFGLVRSLFRI